MTEQFASTLYTISTWVIPAILAITFHEAAHGYAARRFGDHTASFQGRVTLNPFKHIDPIGTILLPGLLLLTRAPFLFGYAKPVPVNFAALRNPRRDMIWVAAAGPGINIVLAIASALLFHIVQYLPEPVGSWFAQNLINSILVNVVLAVFNMLPIPPLDGGRVAVGLLPDSLARPLAKLESYGFMIIIGLLLILPLLGKNLGVDLNVISWYISTGAMAIIRAILTLTGNG